MSLQEEKVHKLFTRNDFTDHAKNALSSMWDYSKTKTFCDITLVSAIDGKKIVAHRNVLSATNEYFRTMFNSQFKEAVEKEVTITDISGDNLEALIKYFYTGIIDITEENAQLLLPQASLMMISELVDACADFIFSLISPGNCITITQYAKLCNCERLLKNSEEYLNENFINVVVCNEFLNLNQDQVYEYLSNDELCVNNEKDVFEALIRWIEHDLDTRSSALTKLLPTIRLHHIENSYLFEYIIKRRNKPYHLSLMGGIEQHLFSSQAISERAGLKPNRIVFVYDQKVKIYNPQTSVVESDYTFSKCTSFKPALMDEKIIIVGENKCHYIDLTTGTSHELLLPQTKRSYHTVLVLKRYLYAIGGTNNNNHVERLDIKLNTWNYVACMNKGRRSHTTVSLNGKLYAIGGYDLVNNLCLNSVECYDPNTNQWTICKNMLKCRSRPTAIVKNGEIFVFGGNDNSSTLRCIEKYNPESDSWYIVSEMTTKRREVSAFVYNKKICLYGGHDGNKWLNSIEEYDPVTNKCTLISEHNFHFLQCINEKIHIFPYFSRSKLL